MVTIEQTRCQCDHCEELGQGVILTTVNGDQISSIQLCNDCAAYFGKEMNPSLITTIESQEKEIKRLSTCQNCGGSGINELCHDPYYAVPCECTVDWMGEVMKLNGKIESQKEEIEKLQAIIHESVLAGFREQVDKAKVDTGTLKEIREELRKAANYKAITELAVKGLNQILIIRDWQVDDPVILMVKEVDSTLSEIERLSHA